MKIELTKEQAKAFSSGVAIIIQLPKPEPKLWEPPGGEWFITAVHSVMESPTCDTTRLAGRERQTEQQAIESASASKRRDILEAFRYAGWPDWKADWKDISQAKWYPVYDHARKMWVALANPSTENPCCVYGPREYAEQAARMLNEGRLRLA